MSLILLEGFDAGDYISRRTASGGAGISTAQARTGTHSFYNDSGFTRFIYWAVNNTPTLIHGAAFKIITTSARLMGFYSDGTSTLHVYVDMNVDGSLSVKRGDGFEFFRSNPNVMSGANDRWHYVELYVTLSDTVGVVKLQVDNVLLYNGTGLDTKNGGTETNLTTVYYGSNGERYMDDVYIANETGTKNNDLLGDTEVRAIFPDGNGTNSGLTGSDGNSVDNYLLVDEATPDTAEYVESDTPGTKDTYQFPDLGVLGDIHAVQASIYARKSEAGPISARLLALEGGTEAQGTDEVLQVDWAAHDELWEDDPVNTGDWTVTNFNATEFGVEVRS